MIQDDDAPADDGSAQLPSPERKLLIWAALIFGINMVCLLMLAARASAPVEMRGYFDVVIFALLIGAASFAVIRLMFLYPFRLLDLLVIVISLSGGMKAAIDAARAIRESKWKWLISYVDSYSHQGPDNGSYILYAEACMLTACVMMGGAALGLRHCRLLNIESPMKRAVTLVFGMISLPALAGLVSIPFHLLSTLFDGKENLRESVAWSAALAVSFAATVMNTALALKTVALNTQNITPGGKFRD